MSHLPQRVLTCDPWLGAGLCMQPTSGAGSSEALLSGQKPPFRLLVRAMNASDNSRATDFKFLVSEAFVVWPMPLVCSSPQTTAAAYLAGMQR